MYQVQVNPFGMVNEARSFQIPIEEHPKTSTIIISFRRSLPFSLLSQSDGVDGMNGNAICTLSLLLHRSTDRDRPRDERKKTEGNHFVWPSLISHPTCKERRRDR